MNDESRSVEKVLATLQPPEPPRGLQEKTLRGAREALAREAGRDIWTRIWESRPLRTAWAAATTVLVVCHIGITGVRSVRTPAVGQTTGAAREANGELAAIGCLPRLNEDAWPLIGTDAYRLVEEQEADRALPAAGSGKESVS